MINICVVVFDRVLTIIMRTQYGRAFLTLGVFQLQEINISASISIPICDAKECDSLVDRIKFCEGKNGNQSSKKPKEQRKIWLLKVYSWEFLNG